MFILYMGLYALLFFPLLNYSRFTQDEDPAGLIYLLYQGAWGFWVILGAIWVHEQIETKSNSYNFLKILQASQSSRRRSLCLHKPGIRWRTFKSNGFI